MSKEVDHVAFQVDNIKDSIDWYEKYCGAEVISVYGDWAMLKVEGIKLALTLNESHPYHFAIECKNISDMPSFLEEGSYSEHRDGSQYIYFVDPSGNAIEWIYYPDKKL